MPEAPPTVSFRNLAEGFLSAGRQFAARPAFYYEEGKAEKEISYGAFIEMASSVASVLVSAGVLPGDRVAILCPPRLEWCAAFAGALIAGAAVVPVNETAPEAEQRAILSDSGPKVVFACDGTLHLPALGELRDALTVNFDSPEFRNQLQAAYAERPPKFPGLDRAPEDTAVLLYTSGTTGLPKGVVLSHFNLLADVRAILDTGLVGAGENVLAALPLYHAYPLMCSFVAPFLAGAAITLVPRMTELLKVVRSRGATIMIAVPQMLDLLANGLKRKLPAPLVPLLAFCRALREKLGLNAGRIVFTGVHRALGGRLRILASGGAKLDPLVMRDLEAMGFTVVEGYGLTETSPVVTFNPIGKRKPGSAGKPVAGAEVRIEDGEVLLKGPMVTAGYRNRPQETAEAIRDGWFRTGDLGYLDSEGYLFITGRKKETIVLASGKNIQPEEVERHFARHPLIKEIGVYEDSGSLKAVIVPDFDYARQQKIANLQQAIGWELKNLSMKLPPYMRLTGFSLYPDPLPKTSLGKIKRYRLRELLAPRPEEKPDEKLLADPIGKRAAKCLSDVVRKDIAIRPEKNLELDLGIDSLKRIELLAAIEEEFSVALEPDFLSDIQTVGELVEKLRAYRPAGDAGKPETGEITFVHRALGPVFALLFKLVFRTVFRLAVHGAEKIPQPPFLLAPNHASQMDGFVLAASLPWRVLKDLHFQGFIKYFRGFPLSFFARVFHVIPIDAETHLGGAVKRSEEVLAAGKPLCIFPEGGRTYDGTLMEFKKGIAFLAMKWKVPIVPVWIEGTYKALPRGKVVPRLVRLGVRYGRPIGTEGLGSEEALLAVLRERIIALSRGEDE